jgi:glycosyltransferase involved in cell wall biosynthesis
MTTESGTESPELLKVWLVCTGVGIMNRGVESLFRECFDGLHPLAKDYGLKIELIKGRGPKGPDERAAWCLSRLGWQARLLGALIHRNTYVAEQLSSLPWIMYQIRVGRPDVIFFSDMNMGMRLHQFRPQIGVPFRLIYSNGGPLHPPFDPMDHMQQLVPFYMEEALAAGEPPERHSMVPLGIVVPEGAPLVDAAAKTEARRKLGLPLDRPVILSVGWISSIHKRMDYTITEIAAMPEPRPYFVMLGAMNENTPPILELAKEKLGAENFAARSVPYEQVAEYYRAADVFVLGSLVEAFGRVYVEALMHGLPAVAHDHAVMRFVLGEEGIFADMSKTGTTTAALRQVLAVPNTPEAAARRRESVRRRFSWKNLAPAYAEMFHAVMRNPLVPRQKKK